MWCLCTGGWESNPSNQNLFPSMVDETKVCDYRYVGVRTIKSNLIVSEWVLSRKGFVSLSRVNLSLSREGFQNLCPFTGWMGLRKWNLWLCWC